MLFLQTHVSVKVGFLCLLNPEGTYSFWLHLHLYTEVRGHGQLQNSIRVFQLKDGLFLFLLARALIELDVLSAERSIEAASLEKWPKSFMNESQSLTVKQMD